MAFLCFLYDNGRWLSVLGLAGGLILLVFFIRRIIRLRSEKLILSVPLREVQSLEFTEAGRVVLAVEGPLFTNRFARTDSSCAGVTACRSRAVRPYFARTVHFLAASGWR